MFGLTMVSGATFALTVSATIVLMALVLLGFEIVKSAQVGATGVVDHSSRRRCSSSSCWNSCWSGGGDQHLRDPDGDRAARPRLRLRRIAPVATRDVNFHRRVGRRAASPTIFSTRRRTALTWFYPGRPKLDAPAVDAAAGTRGGPHTEMTIFHDQPVRARHHPAARASPPSPRVGPAATTQAILTQVGETVFPRNGRQKRPAALGRQRQADPAPSRTPRSIATGRAYDTLVDVDSVTNRHQAVMNGFGIDYGEGVPYEIAYASAPAAQRRDAQRLGERLRPLVRR